MIPQQMVWSILSNQIGKKTWSQPKKKGESRDEKEAIKIFYTKNHIKKKINIMIVWKLKKQSLLYC